MRIITLPDQFGFDALCHVQVYEYISSNPISKQQITLNKNTISFLLEGTKEVIFDNALLSIDSSSFVIMKSGHCLMTENLSLGANYHSVLFFFSTEMLLEFIRKFNFDRTELDHYKSVFSFSYDTFIQRFVASLMDVSRLSKFLQEKLLAVKFEEIMLYLIGLYGTDFLEELSNNAHSAGQKFTTTIESNKLRKLSLKELAFLCDMSVSTFKREFEKYYTESPMKWFQNKRLEYADYLLQQEGRLSSEIYLQVGYESLSSFIQAYKAKYGLTPRTRRKS
ncbi:helix-turn-helix transcriptional regulator [Sphingobacterium sp. LRF_L2]|uniref:helix-turn-helix transcriptional regulator n=1 Tax=Sphingobacterium sp. LRF_L2 TaxID=3369421 RepID=UPI003F5EC8FC